MTRRDLIVFGDDWGRYPSTIQYLGRILAEEHRLFWIGSLGHRRPSISLADLRRFTEKFRQRIKPPIAPKASNVIEIHPWVIPWHDRPFIRTWNQWSMRRKIRAVLRQRDAHDPILLTTSPIMAGLVGQLGESSCHYICLDDYAEFEGSFASLRTLETTLVSRCDTVFAVSESLRKNRIPRSGEAYFLPQGVDLGAFRRTDGPLPPEMQALPGPRVGFFGALAHWVDQDLLIEVARSLPSASVVLLGRASVDLGSLLREPNIHYFGEKRLDELARWASAFDVALIPFVVNDLTKAVNPLKLMEYFALGLPVVSTDLPEVRRFAPAVTVASDRRAFVRSVVEASRDSSEDARRERYSIAERHSWREVAATLMQRVLHADSACRERRGRR